jgi:hypothetical protein
MKTNAKIVALTMTLAATVMSASAGDRPPLNRVMREKLAVTQKILETVVTSDWVGLEMAAGQLERLTDDPRWMALKYPEYARHSSAFRQAIGALHTAAAQRDLEATPNAYVQVTLKCVECHRYLARARIAPR